MAKIPKPKVIGIIGGMGPEAGYALGTRILKNTPAQLDQEHLPVVLMSFPQSIGDRTAFLEGKLALNPAHEIARIILKLEQAGAEIVAMACNTAHAREIFDQVQTDLRTSYAKVKLLNMPYETCAYIAKKYPGIQRIGLMSSKGTFQAGMYKEQLVRLGFELVEPDPDFQESVIHRMIYDPHFGIKANPGKVTREVQLLLEKSLAFFKNQSTQLLILGCTELPLVITKTHVHGMQIIDSLDTLAKALVQEVLHPSKVIY